MTALVRNLLVASIATMRFGRAGLFSWPLFGPFALGAIPLAYVGGVDRGGAALAGFPHLLHDAPAVAHGRDALWRGDGAEHAVLIGGIRPDKTQSVDLRVR